MRVLIVEGEPRLRSFLGPAIAAAGYLALVEADGEAGLALAASGRCDLVVLGLPGPGGLEALRVLHHERPELPVIMLSPRADLPTKLLAFELGAVDYLLKPFALDELLARVRVHLRRGPPTEDPNVIGVGDLRLDVARRQARMGEVTAELTDREFRLLLFLLEHAGEVVSRQRLLTEVWGYDFDPRSNLVDVCVRRLRRRLGPQAPIETVRNVGYRAADGRRRGPRPADYTPFSSAASSSAA